MPQLTPPLGTAAEQIKSAIDEGRDLVDIKIRGRSELKEARDERNSWTEYVQALLQRNFTDSSVSTSFINAWMPPLIIFISGDDSLEDDIEEYRESVGSYLRFLASLHKRLHLYSKEASIVDTRGEKVEIGNTVFIVHGHDNHAKESVARFVDKLGLKAVILHEQANQGKAILDKLLDQGTQADFAVVLLTPGDVGARVGQEDTKRFRARQNVILELGLFIGLLGKQRVCALKKGEMELPTDFQGIGYLEFDERDSWELSLANELKQVWEDIDLNKIVG